MSVLSTNSQCRDISRFSRAQGIVRSRHTSAHSYIHRVLVITTLPLLRYLDMATAILQLSQSVTDMISTDWQLNINSFSIPGLLLKGPVRLG